ncbi:MAG: response regulator transcription factor [Saprospiraceae bacterium]|nr:response regulator transcription factor [Saprospiraceae bacterium]
MAIKSIIVEDDLMSQKLLQNHCNKFTEIEVLSICGNVEEALSFMETASIDLIFLDIEMPGATGFDLLDRCSVIPHVIVTSSKEEYAFEAFQYQVTDYLRKPIKLPRFNQAVQKVLESQVEVAHKKTDNHIFIKDEGRFVKIFLDDILFVENIGDYVRFHTEEKKHIVYSTLKKLAEKLPSDRFMRVHRSFIINLDKIVDIEENSILIHKNIVPVSRANKQPLMERLNLI